MLLTKCQNRTKNGNANFIWSIDSRARTCNPFSLQCSNCMPVATKCDVPVFLMPIFEYSVVDEQCHSSIFVIHSFLFFFSSFSFLDACSRSKYENVTLPFKVWLCVNLCNIQWLKRPVSQISISQFRCHNQSENSHHQLSHWHFHILTFFYHWLRKSLKWIHQIINVTPSPSRPLDNLRSEFFCDASFANDNSNTIYAFESYAFEIVWH